VLELGAGNQSIDTMIGLDLGKRFKLIGERKNIVPARFQHASDDQPRRATGIDQSDAHRTCPFLDISTR
jgi:hypothetical protein